MVQILNYTYNDILMNLTLNNEGITLKILDIVPPILRVEKNANLNDYI
jgi:hypothetical protein